MEAYVGQSIMKASMGLVVIKTAGLLINESSPCRRR